MSWPNNINIPGLPFGNNRASYDDALNYLKDYSADDYGVITAMATGAYGAAPYLYGQSAKANDPGNGLFRASANKSGTVRSSFDPTSLIGPAIGLFGDIYGANTAAEGQAAANAQNLQIARDQMRFQEIMSGTSHQREVKDLENAGLNPVLSANSGASTPAGASATMENAAPQYGNIGSRLVQNAMSAFEMQKINKELGSIQADINEKNSRRDLNEATRNKVNREADLLKPFSDFLPLVSKGISSSAKGVKYLGEAVINKIYDAIVDIIAGEDPPKKNDFKPTIKFKIMNKE